ncbi:MULTISPECIES: polysaccharide biosynthesis tyrosine autokinase [unclassified Thiocapsa]|uniref:polysaccharide biosynthesis tyrosine autokinase n=1 Tax=unclassified Thiocapsa TaxID=2641286 RepID=UPI0035B1F1FA
MSRDADSRYGEPESEGADDAKYPRANTIERFVRAKGTTESGLYGKIVSESGAEVHNRVTSAADFGERGPSSQAGVAAPVGVSRRGLRDIIIKQAGLTPDQVSLIEGSLTRYGGDFGETAVQVGLISQRQRSDALCEVFGATRISPGDETLSRLLDIAHRPESNYAESIRTLRSKVLSAQGADTILLAVVSPDRLDGRTRVTANLAVAFAQTGRRTLLIDADLRSPAIATYFGLSEVSGLSLILSGIATDDAAHRIPYFPSLTVIPCGPTPPNPQELLSGPGLRQLLNAAKPKYEVILLDTPPAARSSDWELVADAVGRVVVVTRLGATHRGGVSDLSRRLESLNVSVDACLVIR